MLSAGCGTAWLCDAATLLAVPARRDGSLWPFSLPTLRSRSDRKMMSALCADVAGAGSMVLFVKVSSVRLVAAGLFSAR